MLKEPVKAEINPTPNPQRPTLTRNMSIPGISRNNGERTPLVRRRSLDNAREEDEVLPSTSLAGGTVLGIHNLAIVAPQFIVRPHFAP